ncbi:hypothetical protein [Lewinella sp. IMCC34191]|uniref:hypothetical protein n=1 Tax=Lewinella sp. IMCC34191 TaxID=2259172 RepID=UPI000E23A469|nr:hypothetical protein [Lewinella sp. IMCC34191]
MSKKYWALAALLFFLAATFSVGHHQGDEHFQILEFAAYKLGIASADDLTWEFHERMRPALQPAMAYGIYRLFEVFGPVDPFGVSFVLRLLSGLLTLLVTTLLYFRYHKVNPYAWWPFLLLFHWCLYYNGVRFSSENWGGLAAITGLLLFPLGVSDRNAYTPSGGRSAILAGVCFGLAFLFRYQMALFVGGFYLWWLLFYRRQWSAVWMSMTGGWLILLLCYPLTYWLYGEWTLPAWNYFAANLVAGKAAAYGTLPWWGYIELVFLRGIPPLGLLYVLATGYYLYKYGRDPLSWAVGVFLIVHSVIGRKDIRFLYPLIPLLPVLMAGAWQGTRSWLLQTIGKRPLRGFGWLCLVLNALLLAAVVVRPAASEMPPLRFLYVAYPGPATLTGPDARIIKAEGATGYFYHRPGHRIVPVGDSVSTCAPSPCLYLIRTRDEPRPPAGSQLVYSDRPDWLVSHLPFGLLSREKWWYIYSLP